MAKIQDHLKNSCRALKINNEIKALSRPAGDPHTSACISLQGGTHYRYVCYDSESLLASI